MRPTLAIAVSQEKLAESCRRHPIGRLSLFGSVLRDDFGSDSDIDVLVEFEPGCTPGWEIVDIEEELSAIFGGRRVDMVNPRHLNPRLRDRVLRSAVLRYEAPHAA
jgi:predicted nucleotidyltransferase